MASSRPAFDADHDAAAVLNDGPAHHDPASALTCESHRQHGVVDRKVSRVEADRHPVGGFEGWAFGGESSRAGCSGSAELEVSEEGALQGVHVSAQYRSRP